MKIVLKLEDLIKEKYFKEIELLENQLRELAFDVEYSKDSLVEARADNADIMLTEGPAGENYGERRVNINGEETLLERVLRVIPFDFDSLPLLIEGDSKILRLLTPKVVLVKFKPTVYSYTKNRYGEVPGTERIRIRFTSALFRKMALLEPVNGIVARSAFLAEIENENGHFLVERNIEACNLEVRIKRYHVGSPVHRYLYTEEHPTVQEFGPLKKWTRFRKPVVCFDWRHPLKDSNGNRLADEPISDDYAEVWMNNVGYAKEMARQAFLWLEGVFNEAGLNLIDMCIFIDKQGKTIYGEISPDCMRVRFCNDNPAEAHSLAKDLWRQGKSCEELCKYYEFMYNKIFGSEERMQA